MAVKPALVYKMKEEVVRWRFELQLLSSRDWWIAFTSPTAGTWKRLMGRDARGAEGEVYRFPRDEGRPDVVAVNDARRTLLIVEAKDTAPKLAVPDQVRKSCEVVTNLARSLSTRGANTYWGSRANYEVLAGLLWGRSCTAEATDLVSLFALYRRLLGAVRLIGFETRQQEDGNLVVHEFPDGGGGPALLIQRGSS